MGPRRDLALVTAGLGLDGGGRALVGRLLARAGAEWAAEAGVGFRVLDLEDGPPEPLARRLEELDARVDTAGGSRVRLALAAWRHQLAGALRRGRHRPALLFDLLGIARVQALPPGAFLSPYLAWVHGIEVWRPLGILEARALGGAHTVLSSSAATLARGREHLPTGVSGHPLHPVLEERPPAGAPEPDVLARTGEGFALIVGRMSTSERYKGHDELLEAVAALAGGPADGSADAPEPRLVIAGGGDDRKRLEAQAADLGVADRVLFTGFVGEATLAELYRRCALFAMPSLGEGFGLVYLEAMRAGKPVVAYSGTAAAEIVVDGTTGLLVPPGDHASLTDALDTLLRSPDLRRRMGEAGRERWRTEFTYDRFRARLGGHLDRLSRLTFGAPSGSGPPLGPDAEAAR